MGELSTEFNWEQVVDDLDARIVTFGLKDEYQKISDETLLNIIEAFFDWHKQNPDVTEMFSLSEMCVEVQQYNLDLVEQIASLRLEHDPEFEYMLENVHSEEDFQIAVGDLVSWHFESESYQVYYPYNDWISENFEIYDGFAEYIADVLIDNGIMFELSDEYSLKGNNQEYRLFANNCQNTLLDKFSLAKTKNLDGAPDDILVISNMIEANKVLALKGGSQS